MQIYKITNTVNGKIYVGCTKQALANRFKQHQNCALNGKKQTIYAAMRKYGLDKFIIEPIETCATYSEMLLREQHWIDSLNSKHGGYNETVGGEGASGYKHQNPVWLGRKHRPESIAKMKAAKKALAKLGFVGGFNTGPRTKEHCAALSKAKKGKVAFAYEYEVTFPNGDKRLVFNMAKFCREHNLSAGNMCMVSKGILPHTKGFKCQKLTTKV